MATSTLDRIALADATRDRLNTKAEDLRSDYMAEDSDHAAAYQLEDIATRGWATEAELEWLDELELVDDDD
jgi:hypothetical protein